MAEIPSDMDTSSSIMHEVSKYNEKIVVDKAKKYVVQSINCEDNYVDTSLWQECKNESEVTADFDGLKMSCIQYRRNWTGILSLYTVLNIVQKSMGVYRTLLPLSNIIKLWNYCRRSIVGP